MGCHSLEQVVQNRASLIANLTKVTHGLVPPSPLTRATVFRFGYFSFRSAFRVKYSCASPLAAAPYHPLMCAVSLPLALSLSHALPFFLSLSLSHALPFSLSFSAPSPSPFPSPLPSPSPSDLPSTSPSPSPSERDVRTHEFMKVENFMTFYNFTFDLLRPEGA